MKAGMLLVLVALVVAASAAAASPTPDNQNLKMVLHVLAHESRSCSENMPAITGRSDFERMWDTYTDVDVFLVVFSYDSLTCVEYALDWPQEWGSGITLNCADLAVGGIDSPGDWLSMSWQTCQRNDVRPPYWPVAWTWLSPSSDGEVGISSQLLVTVDCNFIEVEPESIFNAGVNCDPYEGPPGGGVAVQATTWGALKAMFQ
jgi:pimeloyl-ACP methyl ester carboxylesterase